MAAPLEDLARLESPAAPQVAAPMAPSPSLPTTQPPPVSAIGERCPSCRSRVAPDQRYCLECGQRRGDPRLPFMDAVSFMDTAARRRRGEVSAATAAPPRSSRISSNASLIAGLGTLLLAMGVGVLIGHSGGGGEASAGNKPVQIVTVPSGGAAAAGATAAAPGGKSAKPTTKAAKRTAAASKAAAASGAGAASVLHPKVKLPPPTVKVGGACQGGAGCQNGKFTGKYFGE